MRGVDLTGRKFGRLLVISEFGRTPGRKVLWECLCECGQISYVTTCHLNSGHSTSCGCYSREVFIKNNTIGTHGKYGSREYDAWVSMKQRCTNEKSDSYINYGGRGIAYDQKWETFEGFYEDMGDCPSGFSLDRKDVNGDYHKENCQWSNASTQNFNRRRLPMNTSGRTGVYWNKKYNVWRATIKVNHKEIHLGTFHVFEEAVKAREVAELKYFGFIKEN